MKYRNGLTITERRPVVAYVLDLFDAPPKRILAPRPTVWGVNFCGIRVPLGEAALRQWAMMRADTVTVSND